MKVNPAIALVLLLLGTSVVRAKPNVLLLCETAEQAEEYFDLRTRDVPLNDALEKINEKFLQKDACTRSLVEAVYLEKVKELSFENRIYTVARLGVIAVAVGDGMLKVPMYERFGIMNGRVRE